MNSDQLPHFLQQELLVNVLQYCEDIGQCARSITQQVREIVGARVVALFDRRVDRLYRLVGVCPERRRTVFDSPLMQQFVSECQRLEEPALIKPNEGPMGALLSSLEMQTSFVVPLKDKEEMVGMLILLDIMDLKGTAQILEGLKSIGGLLSLILHNSILYQNMEAAVEQRAAALRESEENYRLLFDSASDAIFIHDDNGKILAVNRRAIDQLGYDERELLAMNVHQLDLPDDAVDVAERIATANKQGFVAFNTVHQHKDGSHISQEVHSQPTIWNGMPVMMAIARDITERKQAEADREKLNERLAQMQRLESLGLLAGGIAHDFNNLLGGVYGYIELARNETTDERVASFLAESLSSIDRATALTQQLLTFAKGGAPVKRAQNLFPGIRKTVEFALSGSSVLSRFDIQDGLWPCDYDKHQIEQVVDNLIINAQQAMPTGGTIDISARNVSFCENEHDSLGAGKYVKLSITDHGIGIPEEFLSRIFEPYYTTKSKGHGLGLTICYSIVNRHGGSIDVTSDAGSGCTFHLYLPAADEPVGIQRRSTVDKHSGSGTFLVMDDEEPIRKITQIMLEAMGYTVVLKENGEDAVEFVRAETNASRKLAGMIFDLTIPGGMGGKEAIVEIRKLCPETPVFVASGYSIDPIMSDPETYGFNASIGKPFRLDELSDLLEKNMTKQSL